MTETDCLAVLNELETEVITAAHNVKAVRFVKRDSHAKGNADGEEHA